jgi:metallo-beta-lactamase class B
MRTLLLIMLALCLPAPALAQDAAQRVAWNRPFAPFRLVGSVYYVGTEGLSAFLVAGPQGHVLIDGGLPESAPLIAANIEKLGFKLHDVKYLLINHTHFDHAGGLAELKRLTGAQLIASAAEKTDLVAGRTVDRPELGGFTPVAVDRVIGDGDTVRLGSIVLTAHLTPGHTLGGVSWTATTGGKRVLFATSLTVAGQKLDPSTVADFHLTFKKLRAMRADVFLNFHPEFFNMEGKRKRQLAGNPNAFVDPGELAQQITRAEREFTAALASRAR